jgi:hypothetical protein
MLRSLPGKNDDSFLTSLIPHGDSPHWLREMREIRMPLPEVPSDLFATESHASEKRESN